VTPEERRIGDWLAARLATLLRTTPEGVGWDTSFLELGLSSLQAVELSDDLQRWAAVPLPPTLAYDYPTIADVAGFVARAATASARDAGAASSPLPDQAGPDPIAIIGIGCRLPGASGPKAYWQLLLGRVDAIREVPPDRWDGDALYDPDSATPGRMNTRWGGFLDQVADFDAEFFRISAREAERMDPQQRLSLEVTWEALEDAGLVAGSLSGTSTGVFMGVSTFDHGSVVLGTLDGADPYDGTGSALSIVANRISYILDAHGPSIAVDTACSSSLVAVDLACQALRHGEAGLALAGGVNVITSPRIALSFSQGGLMAPDGRCKPFDHSANGYVRSEGAGVVVLKPLARALADGDRVYAVIRGGAVNHDGRTNGLTAPNRPAQEAVLEAAYRAARVDPATVGYVEAHGTGTAVGDPIEVAALATVLGRGRPADRPLTIGSAKSNLGHLEAAAGVAGLIKTALSLYHGQLPATVHYSAPNPMLGLDRIPVTVADRTRPWPPGCGVPLAGVSSFGFGGTNAHLVLSAPPAVRDAGRLGAERVSGPASTPVLIPVTARSEDALRARAAAWQQAAEEGTADPGWLGAASAAAARRLDHHAYRACVVASSAGELATAASALAAGERAPAVAGPRRATRQAPGVVMVFPGQGAQWDGMGRRLAATVPVFREAMHRCDDAIARCTGQRLWSDEHGLVVDGTAKIQPALFAIQVSLAETLRGWGVQPAAVVGHSMGEIAAAHIAGALSLEDATRIVCERSRLLTELSGGGGLVLADLGVDELAPLLAGRERELSVAAVNGPRATVLTGSPSALDDVLGMLSAAGVFARRVAVAFAAHSPAVEPVQPRLRAALEGIQPVESAVEIFSTVTGERIGPLDLGPAYWETNVRAPVLFAPAVRRLLADGYETFLEVSPHPVLARALQASIRESGQEALVVSAMRRDEDELEGLLGAAGELFTAGTPLDWQALHPGTVRHVDVPAHGWRRKSFPLLRPGSSAPTRRPEKTPGRLLGEPVRVAVNPALRVWMLPLDGGSAPELADHRVEGTAIVPGSYWLTAAAAAVAGVSPGGGAVELEEVVFRHPRLPDQDGQVQLGMRPEAGSWLFQVATLPDIGTPVVHAAGRARSAGAPPGTDPLWAVAARCGEVGPAEALYEQLDASGLHYGPRFRGLRGVGLGTDEAVGRYRLPGGLPAGAAPMHPALLDSCLHLVAAALHSRPGTDALLPLPAGVDRAWMRDAASGRELRDGWCHARLREVDGQELVADVTVVDDGCEPFWVLTGLRVHLTPVRRPVAEGRLYHVRWQPVTVPGAASGETGGWLLFGDTSPVAQRLAERLVATGARCHVVRSQAAPDGVEHTAVEQARSLVAPLRGVIDLRGLTPARHPDGRADLTGTTARGLRLAQAISRPEVPGAGPRLWLVSAGTQGPGGHAARSAPEAAGLWGLGRVLANESPESGCTLVDLDPAVPDADLNVLVRLLLGERPPTEVAIRDGTGLVPRLAPSALAGSFRVRGDGCHLITGGLGYLGLLAARTLVGAGARDLVLLGRGAPGPEAEQAIGALRELGASVHVIRADVGDRQRVAEVIEGLRRPVAGVVHAAGVLNDALLARLDEETLQATLAAKAGGAWHLHELTAGHPVTLFALFSSLAGLLGSPGQGAYAAANSLLDGLARHRALNGQPAVSIAWGPWAGAGLAEEAGGVDRMAARGVPALQRDAGMALLRQALAGEDLVAAAAFDWDRLRAAGGLCARQLLADVLPPASEPASGDLGPQGVMAAASRPERQQILFRLVCEQVAGVLRAGTSSIEGDLPFQDLGFDSLMAIELRDRLETALGVRLSATLVYAYPTPRALVGGLEQRLGTPTADPQPMPGQGQAPSTPHDSPAHARQEELSALGDDEVAALLIQELEEDAH
jgi:myxalamid-type polyketide synthase MxaE and MxaD